MTRTVTAKEVAGWLLEVALQLGKHKLAGEASTYAKRLVEGGFDTVEGIAGLDVGDLTEAGMRKGDAKTLMRNVSEKCTPSGGDDSSINASGLTSSGASGNTTTTEASVAMVESYAIAASRSGAQAAVQATKATEPVPELKGKATTAKVAASVEWIKSISKLKHAYVHHSVKCTTYAHGVEFQGQPTPPHLVICLCCICKQGTGPCRILTIGHISFKTCLHLGHECPEPGRGSSSIIKFARVNAEKTTKSFIQLTQVHSQASRDPKVIMTGLKGDGLLGLQASGSSG